MQMAASFLYYIQESKLMTNKKISKSVNLVLDRKIRIKIRIYNNWVNEYF